MTTQDGYDWPNGVADECWPADKQQPAAPYFREQLTPAEFVTIAAAVDRHYRAQAPGHCVLANCQCARYGYGGTPERGCENYHPV